VCVCVWRWCVSEEFVGVCVFGVVFVGGWCLCGGVFVWVCVGCLVCLSMCSGLLCVEVCGCVCVGVFNCLCRWVCVWVCFVVCVLCLWMCVSWCVCGCVGGCVCVWVCVGMCLW